jgi:CheY-like chemotaxis protein
MEQTKNKPGPLKVLSMETDNFFKIFLHDALVVYSSREVLLTFTSDAKETLETLNKSLPDIPDVIFLCLSVPPSHGAKVDLLGGINVLKALREQEAFKKVPIIIFSKYSEKKVKEKVKKLGATRYLVKGECMPRDIAEVVACADKIHTGSFKSIFSKIRY